MVGTLIKKIYSYSDATLASGYKVSANNVTIDNNGKVTYIDSANAYSDGTSFNFSVYKQGENLVFNINSIPSTVDGQGVINEFITFVESDIVTL